MTKKIEAVYEQGMIRPFQPLGLSEVTRLDLIVIAHDKGKSNCNAVEIIAEIAALSIEGSNETFAAREHDSILYRRQSSERNDQTRANHLPDLRNQEPEKSS